ncbi:unnamed protein product [Zymoseptoria tritici ST99CH_1A5]|uniref:Methyltransferase n=1 Tax=Zymoseptoria tritici ST99CH_1A5 TaxID=1276529 RepID=A0A1Y6M042_ZYMTR|nr:unnamed protein product [Zymoseptoria tritici ST99CH_1A5]
MATTTTQQHVHTFSTHNHVAPALKVTSKPRKHDVETILNFHKDNEDGSPPAPTYVGRPETYERPVDAHKVTIHDVTGDEDKYTLDSHGFQLVPSVSGEKDFLDDDVIKETYYKEIDQLLKDVTGATRTFIFDHTIRRPTPATASDPAQEDQTSPKLNLRGPVRRVHIDQSYSAALSRVPHHLPSEADHLLRGRVQIINVWRPIRTVLRDPLAVAQSQSVAEEDLVPIGLIYDTRKGETLSVKHAEGQKWFYKHHQTPEEVVLIRCFDNRAEDGVRAKRVPHSAFEVEGTEAEEERESIEVRCLVFHENDVVD